MRAAVITADGDLTVDVVPEPSPASDQVLIRVAACGICGSDIHMTRSGLVYPGMIMGHEISGTVVAAGGEVSGWEEGDPVAVMPYLPCGECAACRRGQIEICSNQIRTAMGVGPRPGGLAEYVTAWPGQLWRLPPDVPVEAGALAEPLAVGLHGVDRSGVTPAQSVAVMGGGSIGVMVGYALRARGVSDFVVSEPSETRRETLGLLGFRAVAPGELAREAGAYDTVFDTTGVGPALSDAVTTVRGGGTVVLMGMVEQPTQVVPALWLLKEVDIRTALAYGNGFGDAVRALGEGDVDAGSLASARIPLVEANEAFRRLASADAPPKILIEPS
jgi:(R,R)-butanediol dehydrogenase/meso-butanediol dehydrogenase/diacetyl reductase